MAPKISQHELLKELQDGNAFFDSLVDMIPAKLYVAGQSGDDFNPKYFKGQHKESKEIRRNKAKSAKRAKLDPSTAESTTQTKQRLEGDRGVLPLKAAAAAAATTTKTSSATKTAPPTATKKDTDTATPVVKSPPPTADAAAATASTPEEKEEDATPKAITTTTTTDTPLLTDNKSRIDALRAKLHAKLAEKRGQRPSDPNVVSKRAGRAAEKKKRQEEAKAKKKRSVHTKAENDSNKPKSFYEAAALNNDPAQDLANLDFGRLHGLNSKNTAEQYQKQNKSLRNLSKTKNLEKMLADAEQKRQRVQDLKHSTDEQDKIKAANIQWGDAIKEASGERVKDDPAKLKKALKQKVAKKTKSAKAWKTRLDQTQQQMDDKQKIRSHNLQQRIVGGSVGANLSNKKIATDDSATADSGKKPRAGPRAGAGRAGFEGRKQEFLNKKGQ